MRDLTETETAQHLEALIKELPESHRGTATKGNSSISVQYGPGGGDRLYVRIARAGDSWTYGTSGTYYMKVDPSYDIKGKTRVWKMRNKDKKFSYDKVAAYVMLLITRHQSLMSRRKEGKATAKSRGEAISRAFNKDSMLNGLNVDLRIKPTHNTQCGDVDVTFFVKGNPSDYRERIAKLQYNGKRFTGSISVGDISAEQLTAIMAVLRFEQLNVLDHIALADDSILGPSIKKMLEEVDGESMNASDVA